MKFKLILSMFLVVILSCSDKIVEGLQGPAGEDGADGKSVDVGIIEEEAGENCPFGGKYVELKIGEEVGGYYACYLPPSAGVFEYKVGDLGPSGGYIFYVDTEDKYEDWNYLEAAPVSTEQSSLAWGGSGTLVGTLFGIGKGASNTEAIVTYADLTNPAADYCDSLSFEYEDITYNEWFLPSLNELSLMRQNFYMEDLGSFNPTNYWSSSEYNTFSAWYIDFVIGNQLAVIRIVHTMCVVPGLFNYLTIS